MRLSPALLELDAMVTSVELTLTSIIQGVALYFLTENARALIAANKPVQWLYVLAGLLIILIFWSRSITHTLSLIRWPLEFGHNFLYIACALGESLLFSSVTNPRAWFGLSTAFAAGVWVLFLYDLRLVTPREVEQASSVTRRVSDIIARDQKSNLRLLIPGLFVLNLSCFLLASRRPEFFLARNGHIYLVTVQILALMVYLLYVVRFFKRLSPLITERQEERREGSSTA